MNMQKLVDKKINEVIGKVVEERLSELLGQRETTVKRKPEEKGFSDSAIRIMRAFNKVNAHRNKVQKRKLVAEYKPNSEVTIKQAEWNKKGLKGVSDKTFTTKRGGVVIEINHTKAEYTDQKFVSSVSDKTGKQIAAYEIEGE